MKNIALKLTIGTIGCFGLSAAFAAMAPEPGMGAYFDKISGVYSVKSGERYHEQKITSSVDSRNISKIEIASVSEDIKIERSQIDKIEFVYKGYLKEEKVDIPESELYKIENDTLKFNFSKVYKNSIEERGTLAGFFNFNIKKVGEGFVLKIPENIKSIQIESVSSDVKINGLNLESLDIHTISGDTRIRKARVTTLKHNSISGDLKLESTTKELNAKTVSGNLEFTSLYNSPDVKFSTTSGDFKAKFMDSPDLNVDFDTVSGELQFDPDFSNAKFDGSVKNFKVGKAIGQLKINSTSGDVKIIKGNVPVEEPTEQPDTENN